MLFAAVTGEPVHLSRTAVHPYFLVRGETSQGEVYLHLHGVFVASGDGKLGNLGQRRWGFLCGRFSYRGGDDVIGPDEAGGIGTLLWVRVLDEIDEALLAPCHGCGRAKDAYIHPCIVSQIQVSRRAHPRCLLGWRGKLDLEPYFSFSKSVGFQSQERHRLGHCEFSFHTCARPEHGSTCGYNGHSMCRV